jgi:hypothetical protein
MTSNLTFAPHVDLSVLLTRPRWLSAEYANFGLSLDIGSTGVEGAQAAPVTEVDPASTSAYTAATPAPAPAPAPPPPASGRRLMSAGRRASLLSPRLL